MRTSHENPGPLQRLLGDTGVTRILDFLTVYKEFDYSMADVARNSGLGKMTVIRTWPTLKKYGLVRETRKEGKAKMYRLNETKVAKLVETLALQIASVDADLQTKGEPREIEPIATR
jgi:DNA-binding transcriptional ArsR family regulator